MKGELPKADACAYAYDWQGVWARKDQLPPEGRWLVWLLLAGRGFGKTRAGAEWVRSRVETGQASRVALVSRTPADARDVMVEGESGLLSICPPWNYPAWNPSRRRLEWPNGAYAMTFTSFEPDVLRGPQFDAAWCDEWCSWKYLDDTWSNLLFGLRLGADPRVCITTTPKPVRQLQDLMLQRTTVITRGRTWDNLAYLAPTFKDQVIAKYEGTTLGRQELEGEVLADNPDALWSRSRLDALRVNNLPELTSIVVGVDPPATAGGDECGIVVAGLGTDGHAYILDDSSINGTPHEWGAQAVSAYARTDADYIVAETNQGGEMVKYVLKNENPSVLVCEVHASRGKKARAEPVSMLYEQGKVHHLGSFPELEDQMCQWVPSEGNTSPDRVDALVWALYKLCLRPTQPKIR